MKSTVSTAAFTANPRKSSDKKVNKIKAGSVSFRIENGELEKLAGLALTRIFCRVKIFL